MTTYAEPPDGSIVGWGKPISGCAVRLDAIAAEAGYDEQRWYLADDSIGEPPDEWSDLVASMYGDEPYLLAPVHHLPAVAAPAPDSEASA